jgi:hypothetical protein
LLITDGDDNQSRAARSDALAMLMRFNIHAFCVMFNTGDSHTSMGTQVLRQIAEFTGGSVFEVGSERDYGKVAATLRADFSSWYRIEVEVPSTEKIGFHALGIRSRDKSITLQIPASYLIEKQEPTASSAASKSNPAVVK